jgi:predicted Ser/Thr protein kinase
MSSSQKSLLEEIEAFLELSTLSPTAFGEKAMNDRHLVRRLRDGGSVTLKTADKLRTFMEAQRPPKRPTRRADHRPAA